MKTRSETKASQPVRMRLFKLGPSGNHHSNNSKNSLPAMPPQSAEREDSHEANGTFYREVDTSTAMTDGTSTPPRSARGSIRHVTEENPTASPKSPGSPLSSGIVHYAPPRAAGALIKSPDTLPTDVNLRSPGTPASELSEGWSAVGKATVGGKSGKVIERLQSEIDQLRRGLRASEAKYDEAKTLYDTVIAERDELRASKETLDSIRVTNETLMARRDRKIEQLRVDLDEETERRMAAETAQRSAAENASNRIKVVEAERHKALDETSYFKNQYDVLERSMGQLRTEYQSKTRKLAAVSTTITTKIDADQQALKRYETGAEQLRANYERTGQLSRDMSTSYEAYKAARDAEMDGFRTQAEENGQRLEELEQELEDTCARMRQVMSIKQTFRGEFRE